MKNQHPILKISSQSNNLKNALNEIKIYKHNLGIPDNSLSNYINKQNYYLNQIREKLAKGLYKFQNHNKKLIWDQNHVSDLIVCRSVTFVLDELYNVNKLLKIKKQNDFFYGILIQGPAWTFVMDLLCFYPELSPELILNIIRRNISEPAFIKLIQSALDNGIQIQITV